MKISIFTDASVDTTKGTGGYAFYIGCVKGKIMKAGILKSASNSGIAELQCLGNALHTLKYCKFKPITNVMVYCDMLMAVTVMNGESRNFKDPILRTIVEEINFLMLEICIIEKVNIRNVRKFFTFQHVRAHTGNKDKLSIINNWCDKNAIKYRKQAAKKHTNMQKMK